MALMTLCALFDETTCIVHGRQLMTKQESQEENRQLALDNKPLRWVTYWDDLENACEDKKEQD